MSACVSLFRRRPVPRSRPIGGTFRSRCGRKAAGTDHRDAVVVADRAGGAVGADGPGDAFADDPAAGHDHSAGAGAAAADGIDDPRAVEIAAAATAATFPRSAARLLGFGFAAPCGPARVRPRAALRASRTATSRRCRYCRRRCRIARTLKPMPNATDIEQAEQGNLDRTLNGVLHKQVFPISRT